MKKIALASAAMGGVALIAFGASGTFASFSDSATISNQAGADTFELKVGGAPITTGGAEMSLAPGESAQFAYSFKNSSTLPGVLSATVNVQDLENGRSAPEKAAQDTNDSTGEFSKFALVQAWYDQGCDKDGDVALSPTPVKVADLAKTVNAGFRNWSFAPNAEHCVVLDVSLPANDPQINQVQGDDMVFSLAVTLEQVIS